MKKIKNCHSKSRIEGNEEITTGNVISELLIRHKERKIRIEPLDLEERKVKRVGLSDEALKVYDELPRGTKVYVVAILLRT